MKGMKGMFLRGCIYKGKKMSTKVIPCAACEDCCQWALECFMHEKSSIPSDVPKGHLAVYVGENNKRFVIKVTLLNHPLFKALLDQAEEEYDFTTDSKLCVPCNEHLFLSILHYISSPQNGQLTESLGIHLLRQ